MEEGTEVLSQPILQFLFDEETAKPLTVSELNAQVRTEVERRFRDVWVEGEIVSFKVAASGHWYFTLKDASAQIRAACLRTSNYRIRFRPSDGLQVRVRGSISMFEPRGDLQLSVESLEPVGDGALAVAFEQIRSKLEREGLFSPELKRPLPFFPRRIGVVTSATGAAFHDIVHVLSRRAASVSIVLIPTRVQGEAAGQEIRIAIQRANQFNLTLNVTERIDALIVGRGGGSAEDLWAFNEEGVARAIRDSQIPVISAVGHEIDFTIADHIADVRAATPSAAAEMVAAKEADIVSTIGAAQRTLGQLAERKVLELRSDLQTLAWSPVFAEFPKKIESWHRSVDECAARIRSETRETVKRSLAEFERTNARLSPIRLTGKLGEKKARFALIEQKHLQAASAAVQRKGQELGNLAARLDSLSPLAVLNRGYSITQKEDGSIIRDAAQVAKGDKLKIKLANGKLDAEVLSSEP